MSELRLVTLSALQHYAFCPRQCALIYNEQVWVENWLTTHGNILHERVDSGMAETRRNIKYERGVSVCAPKLGLIGQLDLVEVNTKSGNYFPIEYKRGKPKVTNIDLIQLCAQAICLEEMRGIKIETGAMWYWETRHRHEVEFSQQLRNETIATIEAVRNLLESNVTPKAIFDKKCKACSLIDVCNPKWSEKDKSINYFNSLFKLEALVDEEITE